MPLWVSLCEFSKFVATQSLTDSQRKSFFQFNSYAFSFWEGVVCHMNQTVVRIENFENSPAANSQKQYRQSLYL